MSSAERCRPWLPARISRILTRGSVILSPALRRSLVSNAGSRRAMRRFRYDARHYPPGPPLMRPAPTIAARAAALAAALLLASCVYRMDVQQGNLLDAEDVDQVEVGMTRSQVRFLLGTPMVTDAFDKDRWDYFYSLRRGHERKVTRSHLVVWFEGDKVVRVEEPLPIPRPASPKSS